MEGINKTLKTTNFQTQVKISVDSGEWEDYTIVIRFLFIEVGLPFIRCIIFLPEYGAAKDLSKKKGGEIKLIPFRSDIPQYRISSNNSEAINIIFNIASTATMNLTSYSNILIQKPLIIDQLLIAFYPNDPFPLPVTIHLENSILKVYSETDKKLKGEIIIKNKTVFHIPEFKAHPKFGLNDQKGNIIWFSVPNFVDVESWFIIIKTLQYKILYENQKALIGLKIEKVNDNNQTEYETNSQNSNNINNNNNENNKITFNQSNNSVNNNYNKIEDFTDDEPYDESQQLEIKIIDRKKDLDEALKIQQKNDMEKYEKEMINKKNLEKEKKKQEIEKQKKKLEAQLDKFSKKPNKSTKKLQNLPELQYPVLPQILTNSNNNLSSDINELYEKMINSASFNDLKTMILERLTNPQFSIDHYVTEQKNQKPQQQETPKFMKNSSSASLLASMSNEFKPLDIKFDYNPLSPHSFITKYMNSTPEQTFILLMALIKNGFNGSSISKCFYVPKKAEDGPIAELRTIIDTCKTNIFDYFLQNKNNILESYSLSALCYDFDLLKQIKQLNKEIKYPERLPDSLPFRFEHKPAKSFMHWLFTVLYESRVGLSDVRVYIYQLSQCLQTFFSHYIKEPETVENFFQQIIAQSSTSYWITLKKAEQWSSSWFLLWLQLYKNGNLINAFKDIVNTNNIEIINEIYEDCSCVRDINAINAVYKCLYTFLELKIPANYECEKMSSDFSIFGFSFYQK